MSIAMSKEAKAIGLAMEPKSIHSHSVATPPFATRINPNLCHLWEKKSSGGKHRAAIKFRAFREFREKNKNSVREKDIRER